jgi:NADH-quinone oxidoreductase subunit F
MDKPLTKNIDLARGPLDLAGYERAGGYQALRKALGSMSPQDVQQAVSDSNLRGRGGAGFPTGKKWSFVPMGPQAPRPKYLCVNADEMEPGAFKDRLLMENDPHLLLEGVILSAYAIEAQVAYIFLRKEYVLSARRLEQALGEAGQAGLVGKNILGGGFDLEIHLHTSAGRYICGEETGLLNSLEGKRANPRFKPPHPQVSGLWGKPTIINNVETLCCVPGIIANGAEWFGKLSRTADGGTKLYGVSGRVNRPGCWEMPMGSTIGEILDRAGGMKQGYRLRGLIPGGASTEFLTDQHTDAVMDFEGLGKYGSRMGTGTMVILDDRTCVVGMCHNLMKFFARESCGWCTPCRDGLPWVRDLLWALETGQGQAGDLDLLEMHTQQLGPGLTYCALAPGAMEPLIGALRHFRGDFQRHIDQKGCPWRR